MNDAPAIARAATRPPVAILGVPFDNVTKAEAVTLIEEMIASGQPHYLVTPNVDFLVQARGDVELRRILFEAHLVLCDGTPLVWASKWLGNRLPERVAGADLVPLLIQTAARKKYRIFLLGATPESGRHAVSRLQQQYPGLVIAGHYSPPFSHLLEMNHEEISRQVLAASPDLLFVSFGCPKQEKWVAMHYRSLGVPVTVGVGATIDFLAGRVQRAPVWMQRSGTEWMFRLAQEPGRLFRRYVTDLYVFSSSIFPQWWELQVRAHRKPSRGALPGREVRTPREADPIPTVDALRTNEALAGARACGEEHAWFQAGLPDWLDHAAVLRQESCVEEILAQDKDCVLEMTSTKFIDSTGVGFLIRLQKKLRAKDRRLVLLAPTRTVLRALALMRLSDFFHIAPDESAARRLLWNQSHELSKASNKAAIATSLLHWQGEITAANAEKIWEQTLGYLTGFSPEGKKGIDLSEVCFIDSTGLGLMVRAKKLSLDREETLSFLGLRPPVRNVIKLSRLEDFLLGPRRPGTTRAVLSAPNAACESASQP